MRPGPGFAVGEAVADDEATASLYPLMGDVSSRQENSPMNITTCLKNVRCELSQIGVAKYAQLIIIDLLGAVGTGEYHDITNRAAAIRLIMIVIREAKRLAWE